MPRVGAPTPNHSLAGPDVACVAALVGRRVVPVAREEPRSVGVVVEPEARDVIGCLGAVDSADEISGGAAACVTRGCWVEGAARDDDDEVAVEVSGHSCADHSARRLGSLASTWACALGGHEPAGDEALRDGVIAGAIGRGRRVEHALVRVVGPVVAAGPRVARAAADGSVTDGVL